MRPMWCAALLWSHPMAVDVPTITAQILARLTANAAVLAALGAGATGIVHGDELKRYTKESPMPARPILAYRWGPIGGRSFEMRPLLLHLWPYDDPAQHYTRINALLPLLEAAFYPPDCIPFGRIEATTTGQEFPDQVLGLLTRPITFAFTTRG
jgi:hypothetical protein